MAWKVLSIKRLKKVANNNQVDDDCFVLFQKREQCAQVLKWVVLDVVDMSLLQGIKVWSVYCLPGS